MELKKIENKRKMLEFICNLSDIALNEQWVTHYDAESDTLAVRNPVLSENVRKEYITNEFAFYLEKNDNPEGIFIEYFVSNFVSHHKDFKYILKDIKKKEKKEAFFELSKKDTKKLVPELENVLLNAINIMSGCNLRST